MYLCVTIRKVVFVGIVVIEQSTWKQITKNKHTTATMTKLNKNKKNDRMEQQK